MQVYRNTSVQKNWSSSLSYCISVNSLDVEHLKTNSFVQRTGVSFVAGIQHWFSVRKSVVYVVDLKKKIIQLSKHNSMS